MNRESKNLWISLGAAIFSIFIVYNYIQERTSSISSDFGEKKQVIIAKKNIKSMQTIDESMIEIQERPAKFLSSGTINLPEKAVGLIALAPIESGELILNNKVLRPNVVTGVSLQISPKKRAFSIPVDNITGVNKLIKPGDRVDILATIQVTKGSKKEKEIHTIMQDVVILATGFKIRNELPLLHSKRGDDEFIRNIQEDTSFQTVTLEVDPFQAQELAYVLHATPSPLHLVLRHPSDHGKTQFVEPTNTNSFQRRFQRRAPSSN